MKKETKRLQKKKIKKQVKLVKQMVADNLGEGGTQSDRTRLRLIEAYATCISTGQKTLPTLSQLMELTNLSQPTILKHQQAIITDSQNYQDKLAPYKEIFITGLLEQAIDKKCTRSAKLLAQIMNLLSVDTTINLNKQTVTSFKIVSNENEKRIEGVG
jgi:hypothetical protein